MRLSYLHCLRAQQYQYEDVLFAVEIFLPNKTALGITAFQGKIERCIVGVFSDLFFAPLSSALLSPIDSALTFLVVAWTAVAPGLEYVWTRSMAGHA